MILGVDLGNYAIKTSKRISFNSKISTISPYEEKGDVIEYKGVQYWLGEGEFETEYRKAYKKNLLPLLLGAIAQSSDDINNNVVVGLPLSQYKEDKEYLSNLVMQNFNNEIKLNGVIKKINISDIEVVPEGVAAVDYDFEGIVVDIGGRTTDICLLVQDGGRRKIRKPYSLPLGILNLEADYIKTINNKLGLDLSVSDSDRIFRNGLKIYGEEQDIDFAIEVYKSFVDRLISQIQVDYPIKTYDIALVGGGAERLSIPILNRLPNSFLVEDSFWANANGYELIGRSIWE